MQWLTDALGAEVVPRVDASEERHQLAQSAERTTGTVTWIAEVRCRFESAPMPGSGVVTEVQAAWKWTDDHGDLKMVGFLIHLAEDETGD